MAILLLILVLFQTPTPAGGNGSRAPSDANNASLKDTLAWLKREITNRADEERSFAGDIYYFQFLHITSCNVEWSMRPRHVLAPETPPLTPDLVPPPRRYPPVIEYSVNLKNLDASSVIITPAGSLDFSTLGTQKIAVVYRDETTGRVNQFQTPIPLHTAHVPLKQKQATADVQDAFRHAIKLCH